MAPILPMGAIGYLRIGELLLYILSSGEKPFAIEFHADSPPLKLPSPPHSLLYTRAILTKHLFRHSSYFSLGSMAYLHLDGNRP
jgi:hypothetical protein